MINQRLAAEIVQWDLRDAEKVISPRGLMRGGGGARTEEPIKHVSNCDKGVNPESFCVMLQINKVIVFLLHLKFLFPVINI